MIILDKKRLGIMAGIMLVAVLVFTLKTANISPDNNLNRTVQTVSLPVSNKVVVLDAGHGKPDEGAESSTRNYRSRN